jgi:hypothetical protein
VSGKLIDLNHKFQKPWILAKYLIERHFGPNLYHIILIPRQFSLHHIQGQISKTLKIILPPFNGTSNPRIGHKLIKLFLFLHPNIKYLAFNINEPFHFLQINEHNIALVSLHDVFGLQISIQIAALMEKL